MSNFIKLVAISALIDTDKQGLPLQRQKGVDKEGNPVFIANPCKVFSFTTVGAEVSLAPVDGVPVIRKATGIITAAKPHHRTIFKSDVEDAFFNAQAGNFLEGRIYTNVPCEAFTTQVRVRNSKEYKTEERSFDTTSVVAVAEETLLDAMKNSGRRPLAGYDYFANFSVRESALERKSAGQAQSDFGLNPEDAKQFAHEINMNRQL